MSKQLTGRVAVVTGSGRGIGKAIARRLAAEGARVVVATRTASNGEATCAQIVSDGGRASFFQVDVTDGARVRALIDETVAAHGALDIVVHAAADIPYARIEALTDAEFDLCWVSIVKSAFWLVQRAAPHLAKATAGGRIVFVSSTNGNGKSVKGLAHYGAAKAALNAFGRGAALELAPRGITVNMVNPGLIASDRMRDNISPEREQELVQRYPIARAGTPEEVAAGVFQFLLPGAAFTTGAELTIDGGSLL